MNGKLLFADTHLLSSCNLFFFIPEIPYGSTIILYSASLADVAWSPPSVVHVATNNYLHIEKQKCKPVVNKPNPPLYPTAQTWTQTRPAFLPR